MHETRITVTQTEPDGRERSATVTVPETGLFAGDFVTDLVRPIMLALGYHPDSVAEALNDDE